MKGALPMNAMSTLRKKGYAARTKNYQPTESWGAYL